MKTFFLVSACSDKAEMTFPSVSSDLLMLAPSYKDTILNKISIEKLMNRPTMQRNQSLLRQETVL